MENNIRYPIGTLVLISEYDYPVLTIGHEMWVEAENKRFNYMGVQYPVGLIPEGEFIFFDHEQINNILNLGFLHKEHVAYSDMLDMEFKVGMYKEIPDVEIKENKENKDNNIEEYLEL